MVTTIPAPRTTVLPQTPVSNATLTSRAFPVPYRLFSTSNAFTHPFVALPDNMNAYGVSGIAWSGYDYVTFAFIDKPRGSLTQTFTVPYAIWSMNITVVAEQPQYVGFRMVLCDAKTGAIITGAEILNRGNDLQECRSLLHRYVHDHQHTIRRPVPY